MSLTGYLTSGGTDLSAVFMNINKGVSLTASNVFQQKNKFLDGGIDLSGSLLYGRNEGSDFITGLSAPYPIGYTNTYTMTGASQTSGVAAGYSPTFQMSTGVWLITIQADITNVSSWQVANGQFVQIYLPTPHSNPANSFTFGSRSGFIQPMPYYSLVANQSITTMFIATVTTPCRIIYNVIVKYGTGSATVTMSGGMTKLA